jgi:hypothetical protein
MALGSRITTDSLPRLLQYGVDKIITDEKNAYTGPYKELFKEIAHKKAFYEAVKTAGMQIAGLSGEAQTISYDSYDQYWTKKWSMIKYEKSARVTLEHKIFNLYQDMLKIMGKEIAKGHMYNEDLQCANVLNSATDSAYAGGDGLALASASHTLQAGGTSSNLVSLDFDEDAIEQMNIAIHNIKNDDGLIGSFEADALVYPTALMYEVQRVLKSPYTPNTANNAVNVVRGDIKRSFEWKHLTDADAFFITTNCDNGLVLARALPLQTESWKENKTRDVIVSAITMFRCLFEDWRCVMVSQGA